MALNVKDIVVILVSVNTRHN